MRLTQLVIVLLAVIGLCSCETKNVGYAREPMRLDVDVEVTVPTAMNGGADATWIAVITGGVPPYSITWDFGGGANPNIVEQQFFEHSGLSKSGALSRFTGRSEIIVTMLNPSITDQATYSGEVTVTDSLSSGQDERFIYIVGPGHISLPVISSATFARSVLTVKAYSADGDALTCSVTIPAGATVDGNDKAMLPADVTQPFTYGEVTATFTFNAIDTVAGVNGEVLVTVDTGLGVAAHIDAYLSIAGFIPEADTLYALQVANRVVIITGATANPFQYLNGIGLTVDGDVDYAAGTFNAGAPGGAAGDVDGAWTGMNPAGGFLLPPDNFLPITDVGGGRHRLDFNLTPIGGSDQAGMSGMLINFGLTGPPGTYTMGFQDVSGIERTYYTDGAANIYMWGTLMADETGALAAGITVDNTYTIN